MSDAELPINYDKGHLYNIQCDDLQPNPSQPRKFFEPEPLKDLADSVKAHGLLQPVLFGRGDAGRLFVVAGERRLRAAKESGLKTIPAIFVEGNYAEMALVENILRQDLTAIELAEALQKVKDAHNYSNDDLIKIIGKAKSTVSEILSLNKLPEEIKVECRLNQKYPRQALVDIAKKNTPKRMQSAFEKYKNQQELKKSSDKKQTVRKPLQDKFNSILHDLTVILETDFETMNDTARENLFTSIEELKKIADGFIEKIKPSPTEKKPKVTSKAKHKKIVESDALF